MKLRYYLYVILFPIILFTLIISKNIVFTLVALAILLWLARIYLDLPNYIFGWNLVAMFKPVSTFKSFKKLFKPNEDDLKLIPRLDLIFSITIPFYFLYGLIQYLITFALIFLVIYLFF